MDVTNVVTNVVSPIQRTSVLVGSGFGPRDILSSQFTIDGGNMSTHGGCIDFVGGRLMNVRNIAMTPQESVLDMKGGTITNARFNLESIASVLQTADCAGVRLITPTGKLRTILGGGGIELIESVDGQIRINATGGGSSSPLITNPNYPASTMIGGVIPMGCGENTLIPSSIIIKDKSVITDVTGIHFLNDKGILDMKGGIITNVDYTTIAYFVQSSQAPGVSLVTSWYCSPPGRIKKLVAGLNIELTPLGDESVQINSFYADPGYKYITNKNGESNGFKTGTIAIGSGISGNDICPSTITITNGNHIMNVHCISIDQGGTIDMNNSNIINLSTSTISNIVQSTNSYGGISLVTSTGKVKTIVGGRGVVLKSEDNDNKLRIDMVENPGKSVPQLPKYIWMGGFSTFSGPGIYLNDQGHLMSKPVSGIPDTVMYKLSGISDSSCPMWVYVRIAGNGNTNECYVTMTLNNIIIRPLDRSQFCDYSGINYPNAKITKGTIFGFTGETDILSITFTSTNGTSSFIGYDIQIIQC